MGSGCCLVVVSVRHPGLHIFPQHRMVILTLEQKSWASLRYNQPRSCVIPELITMPEKGYHLSWMPVLTQTTGLLQSEAGVKWMQGSEVTPFTALI